MKKARRLPVDPAWRPEPCIRLVPRAPRKRASTTTGRSRIGGHPDLPAKLPWPAGPGNRPLSFLAQVDLADLRGLPAASSLPAKGLLSVFAGTAPPIHDDTDLGCRVLHFEGRATALRRRESPRDGEGTFAGDVYPEAPLAFRAGVSLPDNPPYDLPGARLREYAGIADPPGPCHRLLGLPYSLQDDVLTVPGGRSPWRLLLQLGDDPIRDMAWGGARLYVIAPAADLARGRFDRCRALTQST